MHFYDHGLRYARTNPKATLQEVVCEVKKNFNIATDEGDGHRGAIQKAFETAQEHQKMDIEQKMKSIREGKANYYIAAQKVLKAMPYATECDVKPIPKELKGDMDRRGNDYQRAE